jgi:hypothetical protein
MAWRLRFPRGARPLDEHMDLKYAFSSSKLTRRCWSSATTARWASGGGIGGAPSGAFSRLRRTMRWRYLGGDASRRGVEGVRVDGVSRHPDAIAATRRRRESKQKRTRPRAARRPAGSGRGKAWEPLDFRLESRASIALHDSQSSPGRVARLTGPVAPRRSRSPIKSNSSEVASDIIKIQRRSNQNN